MGDWLTGHRRSLVRAALALLAGIAAVGCSNPVKGKLEPLAAAQYCMKQAGHSLVWEREGHLYTTAAVAKDLNVDRIRTLMLTYYSQYPDIDLDYEAVPVAFKYALVPWEWGWRRDVMGSLHSLHGGNQHAVRARREALQKATVESLKDSSQDWFSGLLIHALGDAYAHTKNQYQSEDEGAYGTCIGHAVPTLLGKSPDDICVAGKDKYKAFVPALREVVSLGINGAPAPPPDPDYGVGPSCGDNLGDFRSPEVVCDTEHLAGANKSIARFVCCMNSHARALTETEVRRVFGVIAADPRKDAE